MLKSILSFEGASHFARGVDVCRVRAEHKRRINTQRLEDLDGAASRVLDFVASTDFWSTLARMDEDTHTHAEADLLSWN
jgi:hypothetical protein